MKPMRRDYSVGVAVGTWLLIAPTILGPRALVPTMNVLVVGAGLTLFAVAALSRHLTWAGWAALALVGWAVAAGSLLRLSLSVTALLLVSAVLLLIMPWATTQAAQGGARGRRPRIPP